jgi:hypothetical protein
MYFNLFYFRQANSVLKNETNMFEKYLKRVDTKDSASTGKGLSTIVQYEQKPG